MKHLPLILLLGFFTFLVALNSNHAFGQKEPLQIYESDNLGVKFKMPSEWDIFVDNTSKYCLGEFVISCSIMVTPDDSIPFNFAFGIWKYSHNGSLKDFVTKKYNEYQDSQRVYGSEFSFIDDKELHIQNYSSWQMDYDYTDSSHEESKIRDTYVQVNDTIYMLKYSSNNPADFDKYLPEVQRVIESIEFIPQNPLPYKPIEKPIKKTPSFLD